MRFLATLLAWLIATAALAVAIAAWWAQQHVVDDGGYVELARRAAAERPLQDAMAAELADQLVTFAADNRYDVNPAVLRGAASVYTHSAAFPGQFASANRIVHQWLFTDAAGRPDASGRWVLDLSPMLADDSFRQTLRQFGVDAQSIPRLQVPLTVTESLHPGQLRSLTTWGPLVAIGASAVTALFALFTFAIARSRGKALAALGVSALMVGAAGWAAIEALRHRLDGVLDAARGGVRQVASAMSAHAIGSMHQWLNVTLAAGAGLLLFGVLVAVLGGLRRRD